jgi:hypothetical protein
MRHTSFKEGDLILLRNHHIKPGEVNKFHHPWNGPYKVTSITGKVSKLTIEKWQRRGQIGILRLFI